MYRLIIVTAIGNYKVEMTPDKENPTNDDLLSMFMDTKSDIEAGCFMEGWTPEDPEGAPGVFSIGSVDILAYHVERLPDISEPKGEPESSDQLIRPLAFTVPYLGNNLHIKMIARPIGNVPAIYCYEVNGETPADVLEPEKLHEILAEYIENEIKLDPKDFSLYVEVDGKTRNFSQAVDQLNYLADTFTLIAKPKTGKAWEGWKGEPE